MTMKNDRFRKDYVHERLVNRSVNEIIFIPNHKIENPLFDVPHHHSISTPYVHINHDNLTEMTNGERLLFEMATDRRTIYRTFGDSSSKVIFTSNIFDYVDDELELLNKRCYMKKYDVFDGFDFDGEVVALKC